MVLWRRSRMHVCRPAGLPPAPDADPARAAHVLDAASDASLPHGVSGLVEVAVRDLQHLPRCVAGLQSAGCCSQKRLVARCVPLPWRSWVRARPAFGLRAVALPCLLSVQRPGPLPACVTWTPASCFSIASIAAMARATRVNCWVPAGSPRENPLILSIAQNARLCKLQNS